MAKVSAPLRSPPVRNRLLAALLPADFALLQPHLRPVVLPLKKELEWPNRLIQSVFFMEAGIISVVAVLRGDTRVSRLVLLDARG